ncbi:LytR/AlgR family response regulator transcription factor [Crocinitomix algicola]|uniref:LytR/AlgR family response regulator transcription factor n=1 Tax=Crocinitomix algicola TaxID=1740263 RepID=UPI0008729AB7|nr:response regulator transcription factor [Crocinitomix algicola]
MEFSDVNILIVEDQELIAENLRRTLVSFGATNVLVATNAKAAEEKLISSAVDLMLVDINLGEGMKSGTELMMALSHETPVPHIYITANADEKNIKAASLTSPEGFLEKPYTKESVKACLSIAIHKISRKRVTIKLNNKKILLDVNEIVYIESDNNYISIIVKSGKSMIERMALKDFLRKLPSNFMQIHKSYAINLERVKEFTGTHVKMQGKDIPIGRNFKTDFKVKIQNYLL